MTPSLYFDLLLQRVPGIGPVSFYALLNALGSSEAVFNTRSDGLASLLNTKQLASIQSFQQQLSEHRYALDLELKQLGDMGARVLGRETDDYPPLLKQIHQSPPVIYVLGDSAALHLPQLAMVGSRKPTAGGESNAAVLASELCRGGLSITSGLALGVDASAHRGALQEASSHFSGRTIGVMATGLDRVYPTRHRQLAQDIIDAGGALVTEFPLGTQPRASHFPQRNRLISGLSMGTLVIEAALKSGSLITARYSLEHNREVFAVPGSIRNPLTAGCHHLLKQGATLVETAEDVVQQLGASLTWFASGKSAKLSDTEALGASKAFEGEQKKLWRQLDDYPQSIEQLMAASGVSAMHATDWLMDWELQGWVRQDSLGYSKS